MRLLAHSTPVICRATVVVLCLVLALILPALPCAHAGIATSPPTSPALAKSTGFALPAPCDSLLNNASKWAIAEVVPCDSHEPGRCHADSTVSTVNTVAEFAAALSRCLRNHSLLTTTRINRALADVSALNAGVPSSNASETPFDDGSADADTDADADADSCAISLPSDWTYSMHVMAIFVVLIASCLGAGVPLVAEYHPHLKINPFLLTLGKCMGIGIVLSCGLVHMLQPSNESLTSQCVPTSISEDYSAYAYLFALLAMLGMHAIDFTLNAAVSRAKTRHRAGGGSSARLPSLEPALEMTTKESSRDDGTPIVVKVAMPLASDGLRSPSAMARISTTVVDVGTSSTVSLDCAPRAQSADQIPSDAGESAIIPHVHSLLLTDGVDRTISAYVLEFAITVHSVFIGLANGIDSDTQLHVLLVALVFHQMFEGVALGARIVDAKLKSHLEEFALVLAFGISAPLGIAIGVAVQASLNANGQTFLLVQGVLDGVCAGILIYIGLLLLMRDFPEDMRRSCDGRPDATLSKLCMFAAVYLGAGLMSYIGKYL